MLSDPQSVTIGGTANSMPAVSRAGYVSEYSLPDSTLKLKVSHSFGKRTRSQVAIVSNKVTTDPLSDANISVSATVYMVIDRPPAGFTTAETVAIIAGLSTWLTASTNANATKVVGLES